MTPSVHVLILCLILLCLFSLWKGETEVTLAALGAILSLLSPKEEAREKLSRQTKGSASRKTVGRESL
jgi:hypothetical protein